MHAAFLVKVFMVIRILVRSFEYTTFRWYLHIEASFSMQFKSFVWRQQLLFMHATFSHAHIHARLCTPPQPHPHTPTGTQTLTHIRTTETDYKVFGWNIFNGLVLYSCNGYVQHCWIIKFPFVSIEKLHRLINASWFVWWKSCVFLWFSCIYASRYVCGCLVKKLYTWLYLVYVVRCIHQRRNDRATVSMRSNNECLTKLPSRSRKKNFKTRDKKDPLCIEKEKKSS